MKVALIQPPNKTASLKVPPLGLAYLAAVLKQDGIPVKILDLNAQTASIDGYLLHEKPDVVGVTCTIANAVNAFEVAKQTKQVLPNSTVVFGGPYPSMMGAKLLEEHPEVDASLVGEAEYTFLEFVKQLQAGKNLGSVGGLIYRKDNAVKTNPVLKPVLPLDQIPYPAREELDMPLYKENMGTVFTSRGCPQQCVFCSRPVFGKLWRGHSPEYVLAEIEQLIKNYHISTLSVLDDNFTVDLNRAEQILDGIIAKKWKLGIYFWNGMRVDHINEPLLTKLKRAGCTAINFGVESVDPKVIGFIQKGVTLEQIEHAITLTKQAGIKANTFLMIGNPKDTAVSAGKLVDFVQRIQVDGVHLSMATPILGTPFWDWVEQNGRWLNCDHEELLDWPIDDIEDAYPVFETADFTAQERKSAYNKVRGFLDSQGLII
ncbi:MAG: radical SAM protein [Candidatus Bathyarchaeia archaeon]|jgi:radical SAM superfamily enzyme YgiQ (UPF0313 family)